VQDSLWQAEGVLLGNMVAAQIKLGQFKAAVQETCPDLIRKCVQPEKGRCSTGRAGTLSCQLRLVWVLAAFCACQTTRSFLLLLLLPPPPGPLITPRRTCVWLRSALVLALLSMTAQSASSTKDWPRPRRREHTHMVGAGSWGMSKGCCLFHANGVGGCCFEQGW
jgi:hypothetical protein